MTTEPTKKKTYWIRFHYTECPACGGGYTEERERVYDVPKPEDPQERHVYHQHYDYCCEPVAITFGE